MKILHIAPFFFGSTAYRRLKAFSQIGFEVANYDIDVHYKHWVRGLVSLGRRFPWSITHYRINQEIYIYALMHRPEVFFVEKAKYLYPSTIKKIKKLLPDSIWLHFSPDDYRNQSNFNILQRKNLNNFDRIITTKRYNVGWLKKKYGEKVDLILSGGPDAVNEVVEENFCYKVSFIGQYEYERAQSIINLARHVKVDIFGPDWTALAGISRNIELHEPVWGEKYIETIKKSNINLCFLRKANKDLSTTRTFELASVGALMVAERTEEHLSLFTEGAEALYFSNDEELCEIVQRIVEEPNNPTWAAIRSNLLKKYASSNYSDQKIWDYYYKNNVVINHSFSI